MKMEVHKFKITGISPLLTNNPAKMQQPSRGKVTAKKKIPTPEEEAKSGAYIDEDGKFQLPSACFRAALLNGLKGKRVGKVAAKGVFQAAVFNVDEFCTLVDPESEDPIPEYVIDTRRAVVRGAGVLRSRPRFNKWGCVLYLQIDMDVTTVEQVLEHLNVGGQIAGVGDFRVERSGAFGRYEAVHVED